MAAFLYVLLVIRQSRWSEDQKSTFESLNLWGDIETGSRRQTPLWTFSLCCHNVDFIEAVEISGLLTTPQDLVRSKRLSKTKAALQKQT